MSPEPNDRITIVEQQIAPPTAPGLIVIAIGVVNAVIGLVLLVWPGPTLTVFAALLGIGLLAAGILRILFAALDDSGEHRVLRVVIGLVGVAAGLLVLRAPLDSLGVLVAVVGVFWVLWALGEVFVALTPEARGQRTPLLVEAVLVGVAGVVLLAWPDTTLSVFTMLAGLLMMVMGLAGVWAGWRLHGAARTAMAMDRE